MSYPHAETGTGKEELPVGPKLSNIRSALRKESHQNLKLVDTGGFVLGANQGGGPILSGKADVLKSSSKGKGGGKYEKKAGKVKSQSISKTPKEKGRLTEGKDFPGT